MSGQAQDAGRQRCACGAVRKSFRDFKRKERDHGTWTHELMVIWVQKQCRRGKGGCKSMVNSRCQ